MEGPRALPGRPPSRAVHPVAAVLVALLGAILLATAYTSVVRADPPPCELPVVQRLHRRQPGLGQGDRGLHGRLLVHPGRHVLPVRRRRLLVGRTDEVGSDEHRQRLFDVETVRRRTDAGNRRPRRVGRRLPGEPDRRLRSSATTSPAPTTTYRRPPRAGHQGHADQGARDRGLQGQLPDRRHRLRLAGGPGLLGRQGGRSAHPDRPDRLPGRGDVRPGAAGHASAATPCLSGLRRGRLQRGARRRGPGSRSCPSRPRRPRPSRPRPRRRRRSRHRPRRRHRVPTAEPDARRPRAATPEPTPRRQARCSARPDGREPSTSPVAVVVDALPVTERQPVRARPRELRRRARPDRPGRRRHEPPAHPARRLPVRADRRDLQQHDGRQPRRGPRLVAAPDRRAARLRRRHQLRRAPGCRNCPGRAGSGASSACSTSSA